MGKRQAKTDGGMDPGLYRQIRGVRGEQPASRRRAVNRHGRNRSSAFPAATTRCISGSRRISARSSGRRRRSSPRRFPMLQVAPDELTVISWILPQTEQTRLDNSREKTVSRGAMGAVAQIRGGLQHKAARPCGRGSPGGRPRSGRAHELARLAMGKIGPLRFCLLLVGAACGVRLRSRHLRALRRPDHAPRERRCAAAPSWPGSPSLRRSGPTTITTPTASSISTGAAANASSGARRTPSPGRGMTRRNAIDYLHDVTEQYSPVPVRV